MQFANVFQNGERFFVGALSRTTAGVLIGTGRQEILDSNVAAQALGEAIQRALGASSERIPHPGPGDWPAINKQFLAEVGAKSMSAFMRSARCIGIELDDKQLRFAPKRNEGTKGGFTDLKERHFEIPAGSKAEPVGRAAQKALQLAE